MKPDSLCKLACTTTDDAFIASEYFFIIQPSPLTVAQVKLLENIFHHRYYLAFVITLKYPSFASTSSFLSSMFSILVKFVFLYEWISFIVCEILLVFSLIDFI